MGLSRVKCEQRYINRGVCMAPTDEWCQCWAFNSTIHDWWHIATCKCNQTSVCMVLGLANVADEQALWWIAQFWQGVHWWWLYDWWVAAIDGSILCDTVAYLTIWPSRDLAPCLISPCQLTTNLTCSLAGLMHAAVFYYEKALSLPSPVEGPEQVCIHLSAYWYWFKIDTVVHLLRDHSNERPPAF